MSLFIIFYTGRFPNGEEYENFYQRESSSKFKAINDLLDYGYYQDYKIVEILKVEKTNES